MGQVQLAVGQVWIPRDPKQSRRTILKFPSVSELTYKSDGPHNHMKREAKVFRFMIWLKDSEATLLPVVEPKKKLSTIPLHKTVFRIGQPNGATP